MLIFMLAMMDESDQPKFEKLYDQYIRLMYYIAAKYLSVNEDIEDCVYTSLARIAQNFSKINEIFCPQTRNFIVIITENVAKTMLANNKKRARYEEDMESVYPDIESGDEQDPSLQSGISELKRAIYELPDIYRDIMYLYGVAGYSTAEIGTMLGISREVVKKRLQRGRRILKDKVGYGDE